MDCADTVISRWLIVPACMGTMNIGYSNNGTALTTGFVGSVYLYPGFASVTMTSALASNMTSTLQQYKYLSACLVDGHPGLVVVNTGQHHVHPGLALSVTDARLESLKAIDCRDVHGVALKLDIRVDAAQGLSCSICFGEA